ncbi:hypothetical protein [Erythrobacter sp. SG61-1L]|uniref:hypothetical protein n=1 Tax=Erythrobacter sp. SG61-1L TaxID=1603897 RepID=UPI0012E19F96|nr:hypothetical protein [Erythrobacter sp. SG61-1L]
MGEASKATQAVQRALCGFGMVEMDMNEVAGKIGAALSRVGAAIECVGLDECEHLDETETTAPPLSRLTEAGRGPTGGIEP